MYKLYITAHGGGVEKAIQRAGGIPQQEDGKIRKLSGAYGWSFRLFMAVRRALPIPRLNGMGERRSGRNRGLQIKFIFVFAAVW